MERDFLGLGSKNAPFPVEEETNEGSKDSGSMRDSGMQWSFSNMVSATPRFLSFKPSQEDKPRKAVHDPMASSGFMSISTADAFDSNQKPYSGMVQKSFEPDDKSGNNHAMTYYSMQHFDAYQVNHSEEMRTFPVSNQPNQTIAISVSSPVLQSHFASTGYNLAVKPKSSQPLGGVPIIAPVSVLHNTSSIVGTTDLGNGSKASGAPAQLTIFYAGSVCVYDDVSLEKAQAIMLLAGNGSSVTQSRALSTAQVQAPISRPSTGDCFMANKTHETPSCTVLPSPISAASCHTKESSIVKPVATLASSANKMELPNAVSSVAHASATVVPAAVPQARKASLARFLEKRKERVMNASPYSSSLKSTDCSSPTADCVTLSISSSSSFPLQTINQLSKGGSN